MPAHSHPLCVRPMPSAAILGVVQRKCSASFRSSTSVSRVSNGIDVDSLFVCVVRVCMFESPEYFFFSIGVLVRGGRSMPACVVRVVEAMHGIPRTRRFDFVCWWTRALRIILCKDKA